MRGKASTGNANRKRFLEAYAKCGIICTAARLAKVNRDSHYTWLADPEYQKEFEAAGEAANELLEEEAVRRGKEGYLEPVVYQGELQYKRDKLGRRTNVPVTIRKFSDTLLIFTMKGRMPEKYRDNFKADINLTGNVRTAVDLTNLTDEQLESLATLHKTATADPAEGTEISLNGGTGGNREAGEE